MFIVYNISFITSGVKIWRDDMFGSLPKIYYFGCRLMYSWPRSSNTSSGLCRLVLGKYYHNSIHSFIQYFWFTLPIFLTPGFYHFSQMVMWWMPYHFILFGCYAWILTIIKYAPQLGLNQLYWNIEFYEKYQGRWLGKMQL